MINQSAIMGSLPLLATVLGKKYGVKVVIGGDQACTDGSTIYLPALPNEANDILIGLIRGFLDHESAHIRDTDFTVFNEATLTPLVKHICNILEDWRVENALAKLFPGSKKNFEWLIKHQFSTPPSLDLPLKTRLLNYILYTVRAWDVPVIEAHKDLLGRDIEQNYPSLFQSLNKILRKVFVNCSSTADCLAYAQEIEQLFKEEAKEAAKSKAKEKTKEKSKSAKEMKEVIDGSVSDLPLDAIEEISKQIASISRKEGSGIEVAIEGSKTVSHLSDADVQQCDRASNALSSRLSGLLQSSKLIRSAVGRVGRLDHSSLYKIGRDPKLFRRHAPKQKVNTSIHILLDSSASMHSDMNLAANACYSVAKALSLIDGVKLQVTAFPGRKDKAQVTVLPLLKYNEPLHRKFSVKAGGSTPIAESLWWLFQQDAFRTENRKIILLITDGQADDPEQAKEAIDFGQNIGFEFHGVGIKDSNIKGLLPNSSEVIQSLGEMCPVMFRLLQNTLIKQ